MAIDAGSIRVNLTLDGKSFSLAVVDAENRLRSLEKQFDRTASATQNLENYFLSFGTKFRHMVQLIGAARFAMMDFEQVILGLPMAVLKTSGELERMTKLMRGLSTATTEAGRDADAQKGFGFIISMAKRAPFEIKSLTDAFVKFRAAGLDPMDGSLNAIVNNLAKFGGTSEQMHRVAIAIQQMAGKGVISMEELRQQMGEHMPNAMTAMADGMGVTMAEMVKRISKGEVPARDALRRLFAVLTVESAGSAAEMMDSWVGLLARLGTEWELFKKAIGDSNFFDAAKKVLQEIIDGIGGVDMRRAAADFGAILTKLLINIRDFSKFIIENRDAFMTAGQALLIYIGITRVLFPLYGGLKALYMGVSQAVVSGSTQMAKSLGDHAQALAMNAAVDAKTAQQRMANQQLELVAKRASLAEMLAMHKAYEIEIAAMQTVADTRRMGPGTGRGGQRISATEAAQIGMLAQARRLDNTERLVSIAAAEKEIASLVVQSAATRTLIVEKTGLAAVTGQVSTLSVAGAGAARGLAFAFNALGGWTTVITAGIGLLIYKLLEWAGAAEEAATRARRAQQGVSSQDNLDKSTAKLLEAKEALKNTNEAIAFEETRKTKNPQQAAQQQSNLTQLLNARTVQLRAIDLLEKEKAAHARNLTENAIADSANNMRLQSDADIRAIELAGRSKLAAFDEATALEIKGIGSDEKKVKAATERRLKERQALRVLVAKDELTARAAELDKVSAQIAEFSSRTDAEGQAMFDALTRQEAQLKSKVAQATTNVGEQIHTGTAFLFGKGTKDAPTGPIHSPIEKMLIGKEAELARLQTRMENIKGKVEPLSGLKAEIDEKVEMLFSEGRFEWKVGKVTRNASEKQIARLKQVEEETETIKQALAMRKQMLTETGKNNPEVQDALARLADPFRAKDTGQFKQTEKMLATIERRFPTARAEMAKLGFTFEEFTNTMRSDAAVIDMANFLDPFAEKAQAIRIGLLDTQEQRHIAEYEAERRHQQKMFDLYMARLVATKAGGKEIADATKTFTEAQSAASAKLARDLETPLQKMARDWQDTTGLMRQAGVSWANGFVDAIIQMVKTGKVEFSKLVDSILTDIARIQLQKRLAVPLSGAIDGFINKIFPGTAAPSGSNTPTDYAALAEAAGFAHGGIMTQWGPMSLQKYSRGGIADRPQLAMFGEGRGAEAYVPLPDGRSIPVTMQGSTPAVTVNVINQSGTAVTAKQGQPRFDGKQMMLDVVLTAAHQPGPFRDGMKSAMGVG